MHEQHCLNQQKNNDDDNVMLTVFLLHAFTSASSVLLLVCIHRTRAYVESPSTRMRGSERIRAGSGQSRKPFCPRQSSSNPPLPSRFHFPAPTFANAHVFDGVINRAVWNAIVWDYVYFLRF